MSVAVAAEHLAVFSHGTAAIAPRCDVVGFHLLDFEVLSANGTDAVLFFVNFALGIVVECADAKMVLVVVENIMEYA